MKALMQGKRGLIMGLANDRSLAWGIARELGAHGAELAFSYQGEALEKRVAELEQELASLEKAFGQTDYFMKAGRGQLEKDSMRRDQVQKRLAEAIAEWEAGAAELETMVPATP